MNHKKTDRRILRTKQALRESFLTLLKTQPLQKITVSKICELSNINRSTFYTYYSNPQDLLHSIEDEIIQTLEQKLEGSIALLPGAVVVYVSEHKDLVRLVFSNNGDPGFLNKITKISQAKTIASWNAQYPSISKDLFAALHTYIANGCIGLIQNWVHEDFKQPEEEIYHLVEEFSKITFNGFLKRNF